MKRQTDGQTDGLTPRADYIRTEDSKQQGGMVARLLACLLPYPSSFSRPVGRSVGRTDGWLFVWLVNLPARWRTNRLAARRAFSRSSRSTRLDVVCSVLRRSIRPSVRPSVRLFVCSSDCLSVLPFVCRSSTSARSGSCCCHRDGCRGRCSRCLGRQAPGRLFVRSLARSLVSQLASESGNDI